MKTAIIGSRLSSNTDIEYIAGKLPTNCTGIISGGAKGIDTVAEKLAEKLNIPLTIYEPDYTEHGKTAPLKRNIQIIENADIVLAFWDFKSRGTANTIVECLKRQIPVRIYRLKD